MISSRLEDIQQERRSPSPGQYEFRRKSEFESDFSNVAKLAGEAAKQAAAMELFTESDSGDSGIGKDDDDLLIGSDDTTDEGPGICFCLTLCCVTHFIIWVSVACVCIWCVVDVECLIYPVMKSGIPDIESGHTRHDVWYVQIQYLGIC